MISVMRGSKEIPYLFIASCFVSGVLSTVFSSPLVGSMQTLPCGVPWSACVDGGLGVQCVWLIWISFKSDSYKALIGSISALSFWHSLNACQRMTFISFMCKGLKVGIVYWCVKFDGMSISTP